MSDMPVIDESNSNYVKLPYTLTTGVTATREGLLIGNNASDAAIGMALNWPGWASASGLLGHLYEWSDAAEGLRYRDGEPWCVEGRYNQLTCGSDHWKELPLEARPLHRLAAILCDDAEAFRVLHWCVTHLGQEHRDE